jgi:hypothetical protein
MSPVLKGRRGIRRSSALRSCLPMVEEYERRHLLASGSGFLQGLVYVDDATRAPVSGALLQLTGTDIDCNPVSLSTTSAADGTYIFKGLAPSNSAGYTITETPPAGFFNSSSQALSSPTPLLGSTTQSITVRLPVPTKLVVNLPGVNVEMLATMNPVTRNSQTIPVGQINASVTASDIGFTTPTFATFCTPIIADA